MSAPSKRSIIIPATSDDYSSEVATVYKNGGVIAYPTESFYGLGVDPYNAAAVEKLFAIKGRSASKAIPLIVSNMAMVEGIATELTPFIRQIMEKHWPGPLTIVVKAKAGLLPAALTAGSDTVALRIPGSKVARELVEAIGGPLTTTSANPSNMIPATTAEMVMGYFSEMIDLIVDGGELEGISPTTVIDLAHGAPILLREGLLPFSMI